MITIVLFGAVVWLVVWGLTPARQAMYSANVQYYMATKGKAIKGHLIDSIVDARFGSRFDYLIVIVEDEKHKTKRISIPIFDNGPKKGIQNDEVDLVNGFESYGDWYHSLDKDIEKLKKRAAWND